MWPHKKFFKITWGKSKKLSKGEPLLKAKLKAEPAKRKKRGILKVKRAKKGKTVVKRIEPRKKVSFSKKKTFGVRQAQQEKVYRGRAHLGEAEYVAPGDPINVRWTRGEAGRAERVVAPRRRRIMLV